MSPLKGHPHRVDTSPVTTHSCAARARDRFDRLHGEQNGFTIVESIMALVLVVILFVGVATTLQLAIRHQREVRMQQQAAALALEYIEFARSLTWDQLNLASAPPPGTPNISGNFVLGSAFNLPGDEALEIDTTNGLVTPVSIGGEVVDGQAYDIYQYVSAVDTDLRRYIVYIEWEFGNLTHSHFNTTQVSELGAGS